LAAGRELLSQAEYARHRGVSRQYISRLAKAGVLVMRGGKVDVAASDAVLDDRPEKVSEAATSAPGEAGGQTTTYAQAKLAPQLAAVSELGAVRELLDAEIEGILKGLQDDIRYRRP